MPADEPPSDLDQVRAAFRLGWGVAELRGRYRPDRFDQPEPGAPAPFTRVEHALPLGSERKNLEVRIEVFEGVSGLSTLLGLDLPVLAGLHALFAAMNDEETDAEAREKLWKQDGGVADLFYDWDAQIQDHLVVTSSPAAGYQLGRGLAETYWALYPEREATEMGSWAFLLGDQRKRIIARHAARLSAYIGSLVIAAIEAPFAAWAGLAASEERRARPAVPTKLYEQGLLWRDLVRGERAPLELCTPSAKEVWRRLAMYRQAAETLKVPLIVGAVGSILLVAGAAFLTTGPKVSWLSAAITVLGALGLTSASLYARAKSELTSMLSTLREQVQVEQVEQGADLCPPDPDAPVTTPPPAWKWLLGRAESA